MVDQMTLIFVFGSNEGGRHGAGSALEAYKHWGAKRGVGQGRTGQAYAIPTKDANLKTLHFDRIRWYVDQFVEYSQAHPELTFHVVKIGCGLARFSEQRMAPLFAKCPNNVILPPGWRK